MVHTFHVLVYIFFDMKLSFISKERVSMFFIYKHNEFENSSIILR